MEDIMVSVIMLCYNHEKYIKDAINGVLFQKTSFRYEIIIHDDASTDNSAQIIKSYEQKYPHLIHGIYQTENQYSKKIPIKEKYIMPLVRGKYIALCECDDFWCDNSKLEKQINILENHSDYSGCGGNCFIIDKNSNLIDAHRLPAYKFLPSHLFLLDELSTGTFPGQTCSIVYRKEVMEIEDKMQSEAYKSIRATGGDYQRNLQLLLNGPMYYFDDVMVAHRIVLDEGDSWSARMKNKNRSLEIFQMSRDLRHYAQNYSSSAYSNYYETWHSGMACILKYLKCPTDENKKVYHGAVDEIGNLFELICYCLLVGIRSITSSVRKKKQLPKETQIELNILKDKYNKMYQCVHNYQ